MASTLLLAPAGITDPTLGREVQTFITTDVCVTKGEKVSDHQFFATNGQHLRGPELVVAFVERTHAPDFFLGAQWAVLFPLPSLTTN